MSAITKQELEDATLDALTLNQVANEDETFNGNGIAESRLGQYIKTLAKAIYDISNYSFTGAWVTATTYAVKDQVSQGGVVYFCVVAHSSTVFATDLALGYWAVYAPSNNDPVFTGTLEVPAILTDVITAALASDFSGGGIYLGSNAAPNLLNDYEYGLFTPNLTNIGDADTIDRIGQYTKIGNIVHITARYHLNSNTASGPVVFSNLPFVSSSQGNSQNVLSLYASGFSTTRSNLTALTTVGGSFFEVFYNSGSTIAALDMSDLGSGAIMIVSGSYRVD